MYRKIAMALSVCLVCALVLSGCSVYEPDPSSFPAMKGAEAAGMNLAIAGNDQVEVSFDSDIWTVHEDSALLTLLLLETVDEEYKVNINVQVGSEYEGPFKTKDRNALYQTFSSYGYASFDIFELRRLEDEVIIYAEMVTEFTEKQIDKLTKEGLLTEENIAAMGGREYLLSIPTAYQTMIYAICNGHICVFTGTCYDEAQKETVLEQMLVMIDTTEVFASSAE